MPGRSSTGSDLTGIRRLGLTWRHRRKRPRIVRAVIRAWNVEPLHSAAQFNSVWKALDEDQRAELQKEAKAKKVKLSEKGLADARAVFKPKTKLLKYLDGAPNPEACAWWCARAGPNRTRRNC